MADPLPHDDSAYGSTTRAQSAAIDAGLRAHMLQVYNYMGLGLALTGIVSWFVFQASVAGFAADGMPVFTPFGQTLFSVPLFYIVAFAPLVFVLFTRSLMANASLPVAQLMFWGFAALMGVSLSSILVVYTSESIARVFFITAAMFGTMSLYGYTTKRDLSGLGSFLMMGVIGLIIMMVVNWFLQSSMMSYIIGAIGVFVFVGLTAYDTQSIKSLYLANRDDQSGTAKLAIFGALRLYLDFINLFLMLLRLFGGRR